MSPVAQAVNGAAVEDGDAVDVAFNADDVDSDDNAGSLIYAILSLPLEGTVSNNDDGTFRFDPGSDFQDLAAGETRDVTFTYQATDRHAADSNIATVTITVSGTNDNPLAQAVNGVAVEDGDARSTWPSTPTTWTATTMPAHYDLCAARRVRRRERSATTMTVPSASIRAVISRTWPLVKRGMSRSLTRLPTGTRPTAMPPPSRSSSPGTTIIRSLKTINGAVVVDGDAVDVAFDADDVDSDDNAGSLIYSILSLPLEGTVSNNDDGTFRFDPGSDFQDLAAGETRDVTFTYKATDQHAADSNIATVTMTVSGANHSPVARDADQYVYTLSEGQTLSLDASGSYDPDIDDAIVSYRWDLDNDGQFDDVISDIATPQVPYTLLQDLGVGTHPIALQVADRSGATSTDTSSLTIVAPATIAGITINDGAAQRSQVSSVTVKFNTLVTVDEGAFDVQRLGSGGGPVDVIVDIGVVDGKTVATLTFGGGLTQFGSLVDGNYHLTVRADRIRDALTDAALDGDGDGLVGGDHLFGESAIDQFFRFFGDSDGDRDVDRSDLSRIRKVYGSLSGDASLRLVPRLRWQRCH